MGRVFPGRLVRFIGLGPWAYWYIDLLPKNLTTSNSYPWVCYLNTPKLGARLSFSLHQRCMVDCIRWLASGGRWLKIEKSKGIIVEKTHDSNKDSDQRPIPVDVLKSRGKGPKSPSYIRIYRSTSSSVQEGWPLQGRAEEGGGTGGGQCLL
jgi:hypothetical protein